jgi:hypothetical protein
MAARQDQFEEALDRLRAVVKPIKARRVLDSSPGEAPHMEPLLSAYAKGKIGVHTA